MAMCGRSRLRCGFDDEGEPEPAPVQLAQRTAVRDPEAGLAGREWDWPSSVDFRPFIGMRPDGEVAFAVDTVLAVQR